MGVGDIAISPKSLLDVPEPVSRERSDDCCVGGDWLAALDGLRLGVDTGAGDWKAAFSS
jgi:hypothetical protein